MTQGIWIGNQRPKSKKEVAVNVANDPRVVRLQATSVFGNEYDGRVSDAPDGTYTFVGPDPATKRNFFGNIIIKNGVAKVK